MERFGSAASVKILGAKFVPGRAELSCLISTNISILSRESASVLRPLACKKWRNSCHAESPSFRDAHYRAVRL